MIAFVLSGGGSRGALEAGALLALLERNIRPHILVGTSAGALNALFMAIDPTPPKARELAETWATARREDFFPRTDLGLGLTMAWRFISGADSLLSSQKLRRFVERHMPPGIRRFGDLRKARLYVTAADLNWGVLYLWGDLPEGDLVEAVMASAAAPPFFPPRYLAGHQLVDGGVVANVPLSIATAKGATEIYAINVGYAGQKSPVTRGVVNITHRAITTLIYQQLLEDLEEVAGQVLLHHIVLDAYQGLPPWDLNKGAAMVEEGYRVTKDYLDTPRAERVTIPVKMPEEGLPPPPPGAVLWPLPPKS